MLWRIALLTALLTALLIASTHSTAQGHNGAGAFPVQNFLPATGLHSLFTRERAQNSARGQLSAGVTLNHAGQTLVLRPVEGAARPIVERQLIADLTLSLGRPIPAGRVAGGNDGALWQ